MKKTKLFTDLQKYLQDLEELLPSRMDDFAEALADQKKGSAIYAMGSLDKEGVIDLKQFDNAFSR